jgi:hypothetical protein
MASGEADRIADAILRASLSNIDYRWVQAAGLQALRRLEFEVRWAALSALGHLVRQYKDADVDAILTEALRVRAEDPTLSGKVGDLLDDIEVFAGLKVVAPKPPKTDSDS